jgi:hypothetical protein
MSAKLTAHALQLAGDPDSSRSIAQVVFDLALDYRRGERREGHASAGIKPIAGLDQPNRAYLNKVLQLLTLADVAAGNRSDEREVRGY